MATANELERHEAAQAAKNAHYPEVLAAEDAAIAELLSGATEALAAGMLAVAGAEVSDGVRSQVHEAAETAVQGIFRATVREIGKEPKAHEAAKNAGNRAAAEVRARQEDDGIKQMLGLQRPHRG